MADDIQNRAEDEVITALTPEQEETLQQIIEEEELFFLMLDLVSSLANSLQDAVDQE